MVAARDSDFLGDGTVDPFTGLAPALTPEQQADELAARRNQLRLAANNTANRNTESRDVVSSGQSINPATGKPYTGNERPDPGSFSSGILPTLKAISRDPVTATILAAPYGVLGAGAAIGGAAGLGFGAGEGTLVGGAEPIVQVANEAGLIAPSAPAMATATGQVGAPFTMASPFAAGAPGAAGAAAGAPSLPGMIGADLTKYGPGVAMAAAPTVINALTSGKTKEEKALLAKQEQMAAEAKVRQGQQQDARMNQLGQQLLAFNPSNQLMAKMYGPDAAFSPEQMANMVQGQAPVNDPAVGGYTGTDPKKLAEQQEVVRRAKEYNEAEQKRREMMLNNWQAPGPGPTPIQMPTPQPARRY
jgi:hypothetical protein